MKLQERKALLDTKKNNMNFKKPIAKIKESERTLTEKMQGRMHGTYKKKATKKVAKKARQKQLTKRKTCRK